jgi:MoaA/NifB/PqqE/SkfB family radical SAM enzyme
MTDVMTWALSSRTPTTPKTEWATVNAEGHLVLPTELATQLGLMPSAEVRLEALQNGLRLHRPVNHLAKVYIEPTNACNLDCLTCFRHGWDEADGRMSTETFAAILAGLREIDPLPTVYFGGIGEPLFHKRTVEWIAQVKALGARVEMITNGTLLTERRGRQLIDAGLDLLWVSIDGASPESYADVRLGAELPHVLQNLDRFRKMRRAGHWATPEIGVAFVAMRRNIADLPKVLRLSRQLGARHFNVSNVLPVTEALKGEVLYTRALRDLAYLPAREIPRLSLPKMDINDLTREALLQAFQAGFTVNYAGNSWGNANDVCNFIEGGTMSIAWDGEVSPCWPLMHGHQSYLHGKPRQNYRHTIGNVRERSVRDLWLDPGYVAYRKKVQGFGFAPCTFCGGCDLSESNQADCYGNEFPACGGCLWAQGVIQCP